MERVFLLIVFCIFKGEKKGHPPRRKSNAQLKSPSLYLVIPCPLFLSVVFLIRFKKQNLGKAISWSGRRALIYLRRARLVFFLIRERLAPPEPPWPACCGHIPLQLPRLSLPGLLVVATFRYSCASRKMPSKSSLLSHFPFPFLLLFPFNWYSARKELVW